MSLLCRPLKSAGRSPPRTTIVRDVGDAVRTQRSGGQPEYEPICAACNRLAQLSTCTYLLQTRCDIGERRVRSTWTFAARGTPLRMRISSNIPCMQTPSFGREHVRVWERDYEIPKYLLKSRNFCKMGGEVGVFLFFTHAHNVHF